MKRNFFDEISKNKVKSYLIIFLFVVVIIFLGYIMGVYWGNAGVGGIVAAILAFVYTFIVMVGGKNMILNVTSAKPLKKSEYPFVYNTVEALIIAAQIPMPQLYVIKESAINAFATGYSPNNAAVTVTTGAIERLNRQELEGVIAHEISHIKNFDIRVMLLAAALVGVIVLLADIFLRSMFYGRRDRDNGNGVLIVIGLVLAILAPIAAHLIKLALSRQREFLADANGALLTRYPLGLANALKKIRDDQTPLVKSSNRAVAPLFIENPIRKSKKKNNVMKTLLSTHPDINERIARLESM